MKLVQPGHVEKFAAVSCAVCGREHWVSGSYAGLTAVKASARANGWKEKGGLWRCPRDLEAAR